MRRIFFVILLSLSSVVLAQTGQQAATTEIPDDTNPTKAVLFSIRDEYYNFRSDSWTNFVILRADQALLEKSKLKPKGMILRGDLPIASGHVGETTQTGLGDLYFQSLLFPHLRKTFVFGAGAGVVLPTATDSLLGFGKWQIAPLAVPVWFFPPRRGFMEGYFLVKFQDFYSFAGKSNRSDIHYFLVTPTVQYRINRKIWILLDTEMKTNWLAENRTSFRSGIQLGRMFSPKIGFWIKPEIPWGNNREADWILKFTIILAR